MKNRTLLTILVITMVIVFFNFLLLLWLRQQYTADKVTVTASMTELERLSKAILYETRNGPTVPTSTETSARPRRQPINTYEDL
jgi:hypothetical protein